MSARVASCLAAVVACIAVGAQLVFVGHPVFHTWQYALALVVLAWLLVSAAARAMRGEDRLGGRWFAIAMLGALIVVADGFASGLLGPDTETIVRAPGTIAPLPEIRAAAAFAGADAQTISDGDAAVTLRRRNHLDIPVAQGSYKFLGALLLRAEPMPAAYIEASDAHGNHLTVTQPTGSSFLSPVLLFRDQQTIAGVAHPVDGFTLPAANRSVKVVYFGLTDVAQLRLPPAAAGKPGVLFDVFDATTNGSVGIGVAASGSPSEIGGVRLRATLGRYPQLVIASAPQPLVLILGVVLFVVGLLVSLLQTDHRSVREPERHEEEQGDREHRVRPRRQES